MDKFSPVLGAISLGKSGKLAPRCFRSFLYSCENKYLVYRIELPVWKSGVRCVSRISEGVRV